VSRAIDREAGAEREVVGKGINFDAKGKHQGRESASTLSATIAPKGAYITAPAIDAAREWDGWGTALKPAAEIIVVARKPFAGTVAQNVLAWGTGAINVDASRVGTELLPEQRAGQSRIGTFTRTDMVTPERSGRWPANLILTYLEDE